MRPELAEINARIARHGVDVSLARDAVKPRLDLVAGYTMRGLSGDLNDRAIGFGGIPAAIPKRARRRAAQRVEHARAAEVSRREGRHLAQKCRSAPRRARSSFGRGKRARAASRRRLSRRRRRIAIEVKNAATALETAAGRIQAARAGLTAAGNAVARRTGSLQRRPEHELLRADAAERSSRSAQLAEIAALTDYRQALTELGAPPARCCAIAASTCGSASHSSNGSNASNRSS